MRLVFSLLLALICCLGIAAEKPQELMDRAIKLHQAKKPKEAIVLFKKVLASKDAEDKHRARALQYLGTCQLRLGQEKEAVKSFSELITKYPSHSEDVLKALRHLEKAQAVLELRSAQLPGHEGDPTAIKKRMKDIILDKVSFEDTPVAEVFDSLKKASKKKDRDGIGVNFLVIIRPVPVKADKPDQDDNDDDDFEDDDDDDFGDLVEDEDEGELTVTMDFDNISVKNAVRYICELVDLRYKVEEHAVVIMSPHIGGPGPELRLFPISERCLNTICGDAKTSDQINAKFKEFFKEIGVNHTMSYDGPTQQLVVRAPYTAMGTIEKVLHKMIRDVPQCRVETELLELFLPEKLVGREAALMPKELLKAIPKGSRRSLGQASVIALKGAKASGTSLDRLTRKDGDKQKTFIVESKLEVTPVVKGDRLTVDLDFAWEYQLTDPNAPKIPVFAKTVKSKVLIWDGESHLIKVADAKPEQKRGALYLLIRATILDATGLAIRDNDTPSGLMGRALELLLYDK